MHHHASLTKGPITKTLFLFSLPILFSNALQSINQLINSIWVGKLLGADALAATATTNILMFFLISSIFGLAMATVILIGQNVGAQNILEAKRIVGTSSTFFFILSVVISGIGVIFTSQILDLLSTPLNINHLAISYTKTLFLGIPLLFGYNLIMAILRGSGDSKTPFYFLLLSLGLDILLNPLFILGIGPFPKMDISGSALATLIAQCISLFALFVYLYRKKYFLRISPNDFHLLRFDWKIIKTLIRKGLPMGLQMILSSASVLALISLVNSFGSAATAAFGTVNQIFNYVLMPAIAIGGAVTTMVAQNIGAEKWDKVNRITWVAVGLNVILTGILVTLIIIFQKQLLALFLSPASDAFEMGRQIVNITLWSYILFGVTFVISGTTRANGAVIVPMFISFIVLWGVQIPLGYFLGHHYSFHAIWWSFPISYIIAMILNILYYTYGNWKKERLLQK